MVNHNTIIRSDLIRIHTVISDNEAATAKYMDRFTKYVGSVRCLVNTMVLVVIIFLKLNRNDNSNGHCQLYHYLLHKSHESKHNVPKSTA